MNLSRRMLPSPEIHKKHRSWIVRRVQVQGQVLSPLESAQCDKKRVGTPDSLSLFFWKVSNSWIGQSTRVGLNFFRSLHFSNIFTPGQGNQVYLGSRTYIVQKFWIWFRTLLSPWFWLVSCLTGFNILEIRHRWTLVTLLELSSYFHNEFQNRIAPIEIG